MSSPQAAAAAPIQPQSPCPCGTGKTFAECCEPILLQKRPAGTAEELMRSRFTAHVVRDYLHLHRTYLPTSRQAYVAEEAGGELGWTRLVIHAHEVGPGPDTAFVDFTAYFQDGGAEQAHHEKSEFSRIDGGWIFTKTLRQGPAPVKAAAAKVGRNDPCPCGSGKKYKHCCL